MIESTLIGGLLGGIFRLFPEILKFFDRKNERKHEIDMQAKAIEFQTLKGSQVIDEIRTAGDVKYDEAGLEALKEAIKGQDAPMPLSGVWWADALAVLTMAFSKLMRPMITFQWVICLYPAVIIATFILAVDKGVAPLEALKGCFGDAEKGIVAGIINFWFLDRILTRAKGV